MANSDFTIIPSHSTYSGIAQTLALIAAPLFGYLSDRFYRPLATLLAASLGAIGYMALFSLKDPESRVWGPVIVSIIGVAEIGMVVCSMALVTGTYVPASSKGAVSGVYSVFGAAGILLSTKIGGVLFDSWDQGGPFFVMGVMHIVCVLASILVISGDVRRLLTKQRTTSSSAGSNEDAAEEQSSRVHGSLLRRLKLLENEVILKR